MLFEIYQRFSSINASAIAAAAARWRRRCSAACSCCCSSRSRWPGRLARNLQRGHEERERLLAARDRGVGHRAPPDRRRPPRRRRPGPRGRRVRARAAGRERDRRGQAGARAMPSTRLRQGVRDLRTLLVEIHPPRLESAGLEAALDDLLSPLRARGMETELRDRRPARRAGHARSTASRARHCATCWRTRRRAACASSSLPGRLTVSDDGRGFAPAERGATPRRGPRRARRCSRTSSNRRAGG